MKTWLPCSAKETIDVAPDRRYDGPVKRSADYFINSPFSGKILQSEPMKNHCTFRTGGNAEIFLIPSDIHDILTVKKICRERGIPLFILGGGANILVSDRGIPGVTLSMEGLNRIDRKGNSLICEAGAPVNDLVTTALGESLSGLEFLSRLPGSLGGALFMNARCYGYEIADVLDWAEVLTVEGDVVRLPLNKSDWAYKKSPFQDSGDLILRGSFFLKEGNRDRMKEEMSRIALNRIEKGHFKAPSAGSTFKNNRAHGKPAGQLIDECGLKGYSVGGASVSDWHGNILINRENATSREISDLIYIVQDRVREKSGFELEPEVLRIGLWD